MSEEMRLIQTLMGIVDSLMDRVAILEAVVKELAKKN